LDSVADDTIAATARALSSDDDRSHRIGLGKRIDSRRVVTDCIGYAEAIDRVPSVAELCLVAHVSERRLRQAFNDEFELSTTRYFRLWALNQANLRLRQAVSSYETVTNVASRLGFLHLGRFSAHYKRVYRELPSVTLRREESSELAAGR
jgi:AraC family ethanolamine operon transcriptional activator